MVERAFNALHIHDGVLLIENVGNLVCPAGFDLGEAHKVVIASVTEGEDKPLKYPNMFAASSLMLVSKVDLLPHLDFQVDELIENARRVNPDIDVLEVSAKTGAGLEAWLDWIQAARTREAGAA
jgi:hydrogenase nickel incorporation protein HypB